MSPPPGPIDPTPLATYQRGDLDQRAEVPWLRDENTLAYQTTLGEAKDEQAALDRFVFMSRFTDGELMRDIYPMVSRRDPATGIPPTAGDDERLRRLGAAKGLQRYSTETDDAFVRRIDAALADAQELSTVAYVIKQLQAYGVADVDVMEECYSTLVPAALPFARRFVVVLGPNYGSLGWGPLTLPFKIPFMMGISGMSRGQALDLVRIIRAGKTADSIPIAIVWRFGDVQLMGGGLKIPFKIGGAVARMSPMVGAAIGKQLPMRMGIWYVTE
jgi:hypothetical protein